MNSAFDVMKMFHVTKTKDEERESISWNEFHFSVRYLIKLINMKFTIYNNTMPTENHVKSFQVHFSAAGSKTYCM